MARSTPYEVGETKAIFCKLIKLEDGEWINPSGQVVGLRTTKNSRVFVEKKKEATGLLMPLIINKMSIDDTGNWTCKSGDFEEVIYLLIGRKVKMDVSKDTVYGHEGKTSRLNCEPDGYPEPLVQWYKDRLPIDDDFLAENKRYSIITKGRNRQLEIKNVNHMDTGEFVCKVTQKLLSHYTDKTITFIVNHVPVFVDPETQEAKNVGSTEEVFTLLDQVKNLTCNAVAYPLPDFKWVRTEKGYDTPITDDTIVNSPDGLTSVMQLRVFDETYLGTYKCFAENIHGKRFIVFDVRQGNKPSAPDVFSVVSSDSSSITFKLTCTTCILGRQDEGYADPQNLTVIGYKIELAVKVNKDTPGDWEQALQYEFAIEQVNNTFFTATNLTKETAYYARACSVNEAGDSEWFDLVGDAITSVGILLLPSLKILIPVTFISLYSRLYATY